MRTRLAALVVAALAVTACDQGADLAAPDSSAPTLKPGYTAEMLQGPPGQPPASAQTLPGRTSDRLAWNWEPSYGPSFYLYDDDNAYRSLGFTFVFFGNAWNGVYVGSNGYLTFGAGDWVYWIDWFRYAYPRIAPLWTDLNPSSWGSVHFQTVGTAPNRRAVATWNGVPNYYYGGSFTFQAQLFEGTNQIEFDYQLIYSTSPSHQYVVGLGAGGASAPIVTYSYYANAVNALSGTTLCYTPNNAGAYDVSHSECAAIQNEAPVADAGPDQTVEATGPAGAEVTLDGSASSDSDGSIVSWEWADLDAHTASGETATVTLPVGTHTFTLMVTDDGDASATDDVTIHVVDTTAPDVALSVSPATMWPPNHKYFEVALDWTASDIVDTDLDVVATVVSDEMDDAPGDGDGETTGDVWASTADGDVLSSNAEPTVSFDPATGTLQLRAERSGDGDGRTYTITLTATDDAGNSASAAATVAIPHDKGRR